MKYGIAYTLIIMFAGFVVLEAIAVPFTGAFGLSGSTEKLCISAIRIISVSFMFAGLNIALQGIFQALQSGIESLIISVCRQLVFVLPLAYALTVAVLATEKYNASLVWVTFPIAEIATAVIGVLLVKRTYNKKIKVLG